MDLSLERMSIVSWHDQSRDFLGRFVTAYFSLDKLKVNITRVGLRMKGDPIPGESFYPYNETSNVEAHHGKLLDYPVMKVGDLEKFLSTESQHKVFINDIKTKSHDSVLGTHQVPLIFEFEYRNPFTLSTHTITLPVYAYVTVVPVPTNN